MTYQLDSELNPRGCSMKVPFTCIIAVAVFYLSCALPGAATAATEESWAQAKRTDAPVSYTHLDVYKRQE